MAMLSHVLVAYEELQKGTSIEDIVNKIEERKNKDIVCFIPENLTALKNGGRISFDMKSDNLFTGASAQGLVFAANSSDIEWVKSTDYYYVIIPHKYKNRNPFVSELRFLFGGEGEI